MKGSRARPAHFGSDKSTNLLRKVSPGLLIQPIIQPSFSDTTYGKEPASIKKKILIFLLFLLYPNTSYFAEELKKHDPVCYTNHFYVKPSIWSRHFFLFWHLLKICNRTKTKFSFPFPTTITPAYLQIFNDLFSAKLKTKIHSFEFKIST